MPVSEYLHCSSCDKTKHRDSFHNCKDGREGKDYHCKRCRSGRVAKIQGRLTEEEKRLTDLLNSGWVVRYGVEMKEKQA